MGIRGSFLRVERPGREAGHKAPSGVEVKNAWSYTSTLPIRLLGMMFSSLASYKVTRLVNKPISELLSS